MLAHHRLLLLMQGVPASAIDQAVKANVNWLAVLTVFLEQGLPVLLALLNAILNPQPNPTPPVPPA